MDKDSVSPKSDDSNVIHPKISGSPTIAELRRRVWVRGQPKESANRAGKKRPSTSQ